MGMNCNGENLPLFFMANDSHSRTRRNVSTKSPSKLTLGELERILAKAEFQDDSVFGFVDQSEQCALAALNKRNADFWARGGR
jgi:hypothetical protein